MAAAEVKEAADAVLDIQTSSIAKEVASSPNNNKRRRDNGGDGTNQTTNVKNNNNKRRKKKKEGGGKKTAHQHNNKQKRNWIESCSESIARIPSNCAAPVTCVITRSEIEEEPLLPKQIDGDGITKSVDKNNTLGRQDDGATAAVDCTGNNGPTESSISSIEQSANNIATLSKSFVDSLSKEPKQPWKAVTTLKVDGEEKKLFIPVQRHVSAKGSTKWQQKQKKQGPKKGQNYRHLADGDNGDGKKNPYPKKAVPDKFWAQRRRLFSRYDEGIQIGGEDDPEMWYSVTPESIGLHIANRMSSMINLGRKIISDMGADDMPNLHCNDSKREIVIIDAFCGCGGNSIAFARLNNKKDVVGINNIRVKVIAVDNNLSRLKMAANNAAIYGISKEDIVLVHADAVEIVNAYEEGSRKNVSSEIPTNVTHQTYSGFAVGGVELLPDRVDALFLSPPWGGMGYDSNKGKSGFDPVKGITLESKCGDDGNDDAILKTNGGELLTMAAKAVLSESKGLVVAFLPRNIDGISVSKIAVTSGVKGSIELEQNVVNGKVKTVTAYLGPCVSESLVREGK